MHSESKTLHLVEDDLHFSISQKMELEEYGYSVITTSSGEEAIERIHSQDDIDLILMDIDLGDGMDGTEVAKVILEERDIPIIFLSSHNSPDIVKRTENIKSYGYVIKDAGTTVLDMTIKTALRLFNERITAQKIEKELKESKEQLAETLDASKQGYWEWNLETDTLFVNKQYYNILGYKPCEITSCQERWMDIMHPEDQEHVLAEVLHNINIGKPYSVQFRLRCKDGSWKWVASQGKSYNFTDEDIPTRAVGVLIDIDEKKKEEYENILLFQRMHTALTIGNLAWWEMQLPSGQVISDDRKAEMLGYSPDHFTHYSDYTNLLHPDDYENAMHAVRDHIEGSADLYDVEYRIKTADGSYRWFHDIGGITERNEASGEIIIIGIVQDINEQKHAELALRENEEYLRTIINATRDGFWIVNSSGTIETVNQAYLDMTGYSREEFLGMHINDIDAEEDPETTIKRIEKIIQDGHDLFETRHLRKDGSTFHVEIVISFLDTDGGKFVCFARDITERKRIEEELRKSEERARAIIETAEDSIFIKDKNGVYTMVNPAMEELFGRDAAHIIGKTDHDLFGEEAGEETENEVYDGKTVEEFPSKPIEGQLHTFHTIKVPLYDSEGNIAGLCGIARDITEQKRQQEHLHICYLAIENSLTGIAIADLNYRVTYVNPACLEIWKFDSIEEVIGKSIFNFWNDHEIIKNDIQDILNGHKLYAEREVYSNDGSIKIIQVSATLVNDANNEGETLGIIANFLDITDKKAAEKQLQIAFDNKQELLRELQHRAKNSFNTIKSLMHLKSMSLSNQEAIEVIEELRTRVHALSELYTMLYNTDSPELIDLGEYCKRVALFTGEMTVNISIANTMDSVLSNTRNATTIGLIVTELITNSIKYAFPEGRKGTITCSLKKQVDGAVLTVADDGVGLPEDFDLDSTNSMGLMLVQSMVKQIGGSLDINSDKGTRFTIVLPDLT